MIKKLQKKFISISALGLFLMILSVMAAIDFAFFYQTNSHLDTRLTKLMQEQTFSDAPGIRDGKQTPPPPENGFMPHFENKLRIQSDGCLVWLNGNGEVLSIKQDAAHRYSEEEIAGIASEIFQNGKTHGWHQYFKFRMNPEDTTDGTEKFIIGLVNASSDLYSIASVVVISLLIGIVSFLLALLIIVFASKRAVKPVAESYAKQKQFVTDAGHELKTPLTVISANNELTRMIYGDSEWFDSIDKQVARMNGLVQSLITMARMDEEQKPVFTSFNLSDAVYDTAKSFEHLIHTKQMIITFDIAENIHYVGDESKIREVVSILMDNAVKYCDENGKVSVRLKDDKQPRLQVINDFANIADCELDKVFERFYRADKARTPDGSYGLGLSIAKSIAELHGGTITARPLEHDRVVFEVILPKKPRST